MEITAESLVEKVMQYKKHHDESGGGITCSGGEPLLQPEFLIAFLTHCRRHGIHTVLDTAGVGPGNFDEILALTDLVLLDLKHVTGEGFREIAGRGHTRFKKFSAALNRSGKPVWIRQVLVPGITDSPEYMEQFVQAVSKYTNVQKTELLPYNTMGITRYKTLGITYPLMDLPPMEHRMAERMQYWLDKRAGLKR